ncbi:MAG TPA: hypothetical protein VH595_07285 [Verrucomicrobiae bacterium]|nr:hypothetical protein [Verrucomicrobiae bacterium]
MRRFRICLRFGRTARTVTAASVIALVVILCAFAVNPSLHKLVHTDGNHPDSLCLVCAFASSQIAGNVMAPVAAIACVFLLLDVVFLSENPLIPRLDYYAAPTRGPPRL